MRPAPETFDTKLDASSWLAAQVRDVARGVWLAPMEKVKAGTLRDYADQWLAQRDLKPRTREQYRKLLDRAILPELGDAYLDRIQPTTVRTWYSSLSPEAPTWRAQAYSLLRAIYRTAVLDRVVEASPCTIQKAGTAKKRHQTRIASLPELEVIVKHLPDRYRAMALLAAWCGLRFGELTELRRSDIDLEDGVVHVERGVVRAEGQKVVGTPKSEAGRRVVTIPPHLLPVLKAHLDEHVGRSPDALVFPARGGGHMAPSALYRVWYPARTAAGRPDLRFHDLRHTGATLAAATGATLADLMARLGHSTTSAAMRYQHAVEDRQAAIAEALSGFAKPESLGVV